MKKIFSLLIIAAFIGLYCKPITSKANEVLDRGVKEIETYGEFNYFRGVTKEEYGFSPLDIFYSYFDGTLENGELRNNVTVKNTTNTEYVFAFKYEYNDYQLNTAKVYFDNVLIYEADFEGEYISEVKTCDKVIVEEKTKIRGDYFTIMSYGMFDGLEDYEFDEEDIEDIGLFLIQGHKYHYNDVYKGKDVYFISPIDNLLSFEDIKDKLNAEDITDGNISDEIEIYNNTYNPADENITIGDYDFDAIVYDTSGNLTYQKCYVKVVDLVPPTITVDPEPMEVTYTICYTWSTFLNKFTTNDNVEVAKVEVTEDTYTENYDKPGTYYITATVTDTSGNTSSAVLTVKVIDKVPPRIEGPYEIKTTTQRPYTKEEIRVFFTFTDVIDPNVTRYEIVDIDGYFDNPRRAGKYLIKISAFDMYENEGVRTINLIVKDIDYPTITVDSNNALVVESGTNITRDQIIEFLNDSGMLESTVVDVNIEGYDEQSPSGTYEMSIELEDGTIVNNKLIITEGANYDSPIVKDDNSFLITSCIVCGAILLISCLYFGYARRRRIRR
jgi:hypothetical protein